MLEIDNSVVIAIVVSSSCAMLIIRFLNFLLKSRCKKIKCLCGECEREVITETNIDKNIITDIEIPQHLVSIKK